jgi:hypothetical protein
MKQAKTIQKKKASKENLYGNVQSNGRKRHFPH